MNDIEEDEEEFNSRLDMESDYYGSVLVKRHP